MIISSSLKKLDEPAQLKIHAAIRGAVVQSKRFKFAGVSVVDEDQTDPNDGGQLVSENFGLYGPDGNPDPGDVNQGSLADCYFLAPLAAMASSPMGQAYLKTIQYINAADPNQVVTKFTLNGVTTIIYSDLLISTAFEQFDPTNKDLWVELMVKAYALFRAGTDTYQSLNYGDPGVVFETLGLTLLSAPSPYFPQVPAYPAMQAQLKMGNVVMTVCTPDTVALAGLVGDHCYAVVQTDGSTVATMRNPWGIDGGGGYPILTQVNVNDFNANNFDEVTFALIPGTAPQLYQMPATEQVTVSIQSADRFGNPSTPQFDAPPTWKTTDPAIVALVPAQDGLSAVVMAPGASLGSANVEVTASVGGISMTQQLPVMMSSATAKAPISVGTPVRRPALK